MLATPLRAAVFVATLPIRILRSIARTDDAEPTSATASPPPAPAEGTRVGKHDVVLVELATKRPGITVAEAADEIGVQASGLYPTIRRLESQGRLEKRGRGLRTT